MKKGSPEADFMRLVYLLLAMIPIGLAIAFFMRMYETHQYRVIDGIAEDYCQKIRPLLEADPQFKNVFIEHPGEYGRVRIRGWVASDDDLAALHKFFENNPFPEFVQRSWEVIVHLEKPATVGESPTQP